MARLLLILALFILPLVSMAADSILLQDLMRTLPEPLRAMLQDPQHEVQIVYTQIDRDESNVPRFTRHQLGVAPQRYFYPASTVKFPVALFALEKLGACQVSGLDRTSTMVTESVAASVEDYVRKIFLVSDNDAYNKLYGWLGIDEIQHQLQVKGCRDARIVHRLAVKRAPRSGYQSAAVHFLSEDGRVILDQGQLISEATHTHSLPSKKGDGYWKDGALISEAKDFGENNSFPILEQQTLLQQVIFPESVAADQRFVLSASDRAFVLQAMSDFPREETIFTAYQKRADDEVKAFIGWHPKPIRGSLRCYNKSGQAYGFLIDNAYVVDFEQGVEFFLAAVVHVNANRIYNDDHYQYESRGYPFLRALGRVVHEFETSRSRPHRPDFSSLGR